MNKPSRNHSGAPSTKSPAHLTVFMAVFVLISIAVPASAQIVPACGPDGTSPCTLCDLWKLGHNIINFLLWSLAIPVLTVLLLWGGVVWATSSGSPGQVTRGKQIMTTGLVGILIALSAWLVVDTLIKTLAADGEFKAAWNKFPECAEPIKTKPVPLATTTPPTAIMPGDYYTHDEAIAALGGIPTNRMNEPRGGNCLPIPLDCGLRPMGSQTACTSLDLIPKSTVAKLKQIQGITFYISGGTEAGHTTHGLCKAIVDLVPGTPGSKKLSDLPLLYDAALTHGAIVTKTFCELPAGEIVDCNTPGADHLHVQFPP